MNFDLIQRLMHIALLGSEWVLYILIVLSVVSIGAMIERTIFFVRNRRGSSGLRAALSKGLLENGISGANAALAAHPSVAATVLTSALRFRAGGPDAVIDAIDAELADQRARLERSMMLLGTLGSNAPFIGLFGTVIGIVVSFHHLGEGSDAAMANVMAGIAEALIATGVGIFVAIPAVVAYNIGQKQIGDIENDVVGLGKLITAWLRTGDQGIAVAKEIAASATPINVSKALRYSTSQDAE